MLKLLIWGAVALLAVQFVACAVAAATKNEKDDAIVSRIAGWVDWLISANGRAGAAVGRWLRAKWDAWRARRAERRGE